MKTNVMKRVLMLFFTLVLLATAVAGCRGSGGNRFRIATRLSFSEPPALGKRVEITATFKLRDTYPQSVAAAVTTRIYLPEGLETVDGNLESKGDLAGC